MGCIGDGYRLLSTLRHTVPGIFKVGAFNRCPAIKGRTFFYVKRISSGSNAIGQGVGEYRGVPSNQQVVFTKAGRVALCSQSGLSQSLLRPHHT